MGWRMSASRFFPFFLSLSIRSWNLSPSFFHIFPSPLSPNFIASANMSMVGGPPTSTGLPTEVMVESMEVGASNALLTFLGFPLRGMVGMPTRLQESAGCVSVEQGAPSASTVALPIHISDSDMPLTSGAGCRTNAGRCTMPMPACAIHWLCTFTVGAIPLRMLHATPATPSVTGGMAAAMPAMMSAMRSYTFPTCGTGMTGDGGVTVGCMSIPMARSPNLATGMPGMDGSSPPSPAWSLSRAAFESAKRSENPRLVLLLSTASVIFFNTSDIVRTV